MKITAHFDSPDSADFASGALKRILSPIASVKTSSIPQKSDALSMNVFSSFNLAGTTPTYSMPVYNVNAYRDLSNEHKKDYIKTDNILEVVCRQEEASTASRIIIGFGGRDISRI